LGEGPCWDPRTRRLYWVSIRACEVHEFDPATGADRVIGLPKHVGCVVPRETGGALVALQDGLAELDLDSGRVTRIANPAAGLDDILFNDGKCDPAGRFWVGTKAYADTPGAGALYCMETDRTVSLKVPDVTISNGLAWSLEGNLMYYIDTMAAEVSVFDYDAGTGAIDNRRTAVSIPKEMGFPDGMTIDAEGKLWVALWRGRSVVRLDPDTGRVLEAILVPVTCPSSCCFGGPDLDELYITSAWIELTPEERANEPLAGALMRVRPGVKGLPPFYFDG
jgi:sugar lactone lactonase YvrE